MINTQKRKLSDCDSQKIYPKRLKSEEISHDQIPTREVRNTAFSRNCSKKNGIRATSSVASYFKKTKISAEHNFYNKMNRIINLKNKSDDLENRNTIEKIGISKGTARNVIDVQSSVNSACIEQKKSQNVTSYVTSKCNSLSKKNKCFNLSYSKMSEKQPTAFKIDEGVISDEIFSSENVKKSVCNIDKSTLESDYNFFLGLSGTDRKKHEQNRSQFPAGISSVELEQPKVEYLNKKTSESAYLEKQNYFSHIGNKYKLPTKKNVNETSFSIKTQQLITNMVHRRIPCISDECISQERQEVEKNCEFHSMYNVLFQNIQNSSLSPIEKQRKLRKYVSMTDFLNSYAAEENNFIGKTNDFHSMNGTMSINISSPFPFPIEQNMNNVIQQKLAGEYLGNKQSKKLLNNLVSHNVLKKVPSFDNFVKKISYVTENRNSLTIEYLCEHKNNVEYISSNEKNIFDSTSYLLEANNESVKFCDDSKIININKLNISDCEIQSKTHLFENICKSNMERKNIPKNIYSKVNTKRFLEKHPLNDWNTSAREELLNFYINVNSKSKRGEINSNINNIRHTINTKERVKYKAKSCIVPSFEKTIINLSSVLTQKRNTDNQSSKSFKNITGDLRNGLYNKKISKKAMISPKTHFNKCQAKQNLSIIPDTFQIQKKGSNSFQQHQDKPFFISSQNKTFDEFHDNPNKCSIDVESEKQDNYNHKKYSSTENSLLTKQAVNREYGISFMEGKLKFSGQSHITPTASDDTESIIYDRNPTKCDKNDESSSISKMHIGNEISSNEKNKIQNSSNNYVSYDKQNNILNISDVGGIRKNIKSECSQFNNNAIYPNSSKLKNSMDNIPHNVEAGDNFKFRYGNNTQILASKEEVQSSRNKEKPFDFTITSQKISYEKPIVCISRNSSVNNSKKLHESDMLEKTYSETVTSQKSVTSKNVKKTVSETLEQVCFLEHDSFKEESSSHLMNCNFNRDDELNIIAKIHYDETNQESEMQNIRSCAHNLTTCCTTSTDTVFPADITVNRSFSQHEYDLLEKTSSPLLSDLECRSYLKSLINSQIPEKTTNPNHDLNQQSTFHVLKDMCNKKTIENSLSFHIISQEEKELYEFWDDTSLVKDYSAEKNVPQNIARELNNDKCFSETISQDSETEILNHILSQNFTESDSHLNEILKNMNSLSQKSMKQRNSLHYFNQNSNKLLEFAFKMYNQFKTNIILSNKEKVKFTQSIRSTIEVEHCEQTKIYRLKENSKDELIILDIKYNSNHSECDSFNFSNTNNETDRKILEGLYKIYQEKTFLYKKEEDGLYYSRPNKISIIKKIEGIFENVLKTFAANKSPELRIRRQTFDDCLNDKKGLVLKPVESPRFIKIHYKNTLSQPKFCLIMYILAKSIELLKNNTKLTKREIYYQIKSFVFNQGKIDSAIKAVSRMLLVGPWDLNIIAHKGMVFGDLRITLSSNEIINCNVPGTLIPNDIDSFVEIKSSAYFILVVEKESVYYKLLEEDLPNRLVKSFIMITGKGYPDLNTQMFLRKLWMVMSLPIFILTDADPHGVNIMITYRFGSLAHAHISDQLTVPKAKWLGIFPSEITKFDAQKQLLTDNEKFVIKNTLRTPYMTDNPKIKAELEIMLELGYKAGIEGIIKNDTFLSEFYFPMKFYNQDLI